MLERHDYSGFVIVRLSLIIGIVARDDDTEPMGFLLEFGTLDEEGNFDETISTGRIYMN